ncbi:hypothetical protein [uncultured Lacinutrix sp.]|uniref:hypothetical protein n=1 Tax=uncultured Lacinutrix sp. TaxID=574032 RepID=UPI002611EDCC|nr:hypothetical protein [uncultured Lacinutrix sp.]
MLHIIWSIINTILFIYFLYLIMGLILIGKRIFKNRFKKFSILIIVLGCIQILIPHVDDNDKDQNYISINENAFNQKKSVVKNVTLENNFVSDFVLSVKYSSQNNTFVPINGSARMAGVISGHKWKLIGMSISNYTPNEKSTYDVYGILEWHLFGFKIYSQLKRFKGVIE